jgi:uncharacterized membrane protein
MDSFKSKFSFAKVFPPLFVGFLFLLNILPWIAPMLSFFGETKISGFIYWMYSFTCHQKASRSFFVCEHQVGWCSRCTFLWFSTFLTSGLVFYFKPTYNFKGISFTTAFVLALPLMLDGGIQLLGTLYSVFYQTTPFYESTNSIRAITGILFGLAIGLYLFPKLRDELKA